MTELFNSNPVTEAEQISVSKAVFAFSYKSSEKSIGTFLKTIGTFLSDSIGTFFEKMPRFSGACLAWWGINRGKAGRPAKAGHCGNYD